MEFQCKNWQEVMDAILLCEDHDYKVNATLYTDLYPHINVGESPIHPNMSVCIGQDSSVLEWRRIDYIFGKILKHSGVDAYTDNKNGTHSFAFHAPTTNVNLVVLIDKGRKTIKISVK